jgi:hypothetical protein
MPTHLILPLDIFNLFLGFVDFFAVALDDEYRDKGIVVQVTEICFLPNFLIFSLINELRITLLFFGILFSRF